MNPKSLSQQAYDCIKQKIVTLTLPPGSVIDESILQAELRLGRTPIREALQRLAKEKLVVIVPRRGMFVSEIGITDLQRLFEVRLVLERLAVQLAVQRGTAVHWNRMQQLLNNILELEPVQVPPEQFPAIDEGCHLIIYEAADNDFLRDTLTSLYTLNLRLWHLYLAKIAHKEEAIVEYKHIIEHQHILNALRSRDSVLAEQLMIEHVEMYQSNIKTVMLGVQDREPQQLQEA